MKRIRTSGFAVRFLIVLIIVGSFASVSLFLQNSHAAADKAPDAVTPDGGRYYGPLLNGVRQGEGRVEWDSGATYEGQFEAGLFSEKGKYKYKANGDEYIGEFSKGHFQGKGRFSSSGGDVYEGDFKLDEFTGTGIYRTKDGAQHVGGFRNWKPHGPGSYTDAKGGVYEGSFTDGDFNGKGKWLNKKGDRYEGEFKDWSFHGQGVYRLANGDEYKGGFAYGTYDGEGVLTYAQPQADGRTVDKGIWRYGALEDKEKERQTKRNVESAIYHQRSLLDQSLAALAPREQGKINLYLLAIAGDGAQEVFRREVEFVRNQFDRDYGTKTRSMVLVNSRNTVTTIPMATLTSIRESVAAIAARMDKEKDILFLYLTSHGSKKHVFTLDQNGMDLQGLDAKELGQILKDSGIRWKVVVISACYAGGFIEPLNDGQTTIITAARHDRASFGCADENDFTYFGKAYFKDSLPVSTSFSDAFERSKKLVAKREADDLKPDEKAPDEHHSEPQILAPAKVESYVQQWWQAQQRAGVK